MKGIIFVQSFHYIAKSKAMKFCSCFVVAMWSLTIATGKLEFSTERKMEVGEALASRITLTVIQR